MYEIVAYLIAFLVYALLTALAVVPLTLAVMFSGWWLLLYIVTIPTSVIVRELI